METLNSMKNEFPETHADLFKGQTFNLGITLRYKLKALKIMERLETDFNINKRKTHDSDIFVDKETFSLHLKDLPFSDKD